MERDFTAEEVAMILFLYTAELLGAQPPAFDRALWTRQQEAVRASWREKVTAYQQMLDAGN